MKLRITLLFLICLFASNLCFASDVVFVDTSKGPSITFQQIDLVCRFYGLNLSHLSLEQGKANSWIKENLSQLKGGAVIFDACALQYINPEEVLPAMKVPCLIINITPTTGSEILKRWSGGAVMDCRSFEHVSPNGFYKVADLKDITAELAGQVFPFSGDTGDSGYILILDRKKRAQSLVEIGYDEKGNYFPVFIKATVSGKKVFFHSGIQRRESSKESRWEYDKEHFFEIAPVMMFIRYSLGEKCWHPVKYFANFIIDDPYLTEPYGNLNYHELLREMKEAHFHTTIAFIPWNYDRSEPEVVSLFRDNPERFSICIHGNNHNHMEFSEDKSLVSNEANIKQAISRMEKFKSLTGLSYDRVMVFPHGISPTGVLAILKKYNFLSTVNENNIPIGSKIEKKDPIDMMRSYFLGTRNFPSLKRYYVVNPKSDITIELFLYGHILFYAHQNLFKNDVIQLEKTVRTINNIRPDIEWRSLGYISQHLYLEKYRNEREYNILAFCNNIIIENKHQRRMTYFVSKDESYPLPIKQLLIDNRPSPYEMKGNTLFFKTSIPADGSKHIFVEYENDLNFAPVDPAKHNLYFALLRRISDFRDMVLSKNEIGNKFVRLYYYKNIDRVMAIGIATFSGTLIILIVSFRYYLRKRANK